MTKWMFGVMALFFVVFGATVLITGEPEFLVPVGILAALVFGYAVLNRVLRQRIIRRDGSLENAMSDETDPIPSAHLIPDDQTPLGDTPEAHDEITPHDLPLSHPGRAAAEEQADGQTGMTGGDHDPSQVGERS